MIARIRGLFGARKIDAGPIATLFRRYDLTDEWTSVLGWRHDAPGSRVTIVFSTILSTVPWSFHDFWGGAPIDGRDVRVDFKGVADLSVTTAAGLETHDDGDIVWLADLELDEFDVADDAPGRHRARVVADDLSLSFTFEALSFREVVTAFHPKGRADFAM